MNFIVTSVSNIYQFAVTMKNPRIQLLIGTIISVVALYITFRQVNLRDLWNAMVAFNWWWCVPFSIVNLASLYVRAIRWRYLMPPGRVLSPNRLFPPMMIGFSINSMLPMRVGEFARAYVLGKKEKMSMSAIFGTVVVERIFDSISLLILLFIVFSTVQFDPNLKFSYGQYEITGAKLKDLSRGITWGLLILVAGSFFIMWNRGRELVQQMIERVPFAPRRFRLKLNDIITAFSHGLASLRSIKAAAIVMSLSLVVWVLVGWSMKIGARGFEGMHMTLLQGIAITVITCIAIILPATPGYWGLAEAGVVFGMLVLNVDPSASRALAYALITHSLQYFPVLLIGLYFLWKAGMSIHEITEHRSDVEA